MDLLLEARSALLAAEQRLRSLMGAAVQNGRYLEVARLADMAQALEQISKLADIAPGRNVSTQVKSDVPARRTSKSEAPKTKPHEEFPKFARDGDQLIKIGWSKRNKSEYEHKVLRTAALSVYLQLGERTDSGGFKMEELLPIKMTDGSDVPSYQSYLVLAWLRHFQLVEKLGKNSYQWMIEGIDDASFQKVWESTPRKTVSFRSNRK